MTEASQPIDPQVIDGLKQLEGPMQQIRDFVGEIPSRRQEIQTAIDDVRSQKRTWDDLFTNFSAKKQDLDEVISQIHQAQSTYANARPDADNQISHIQSIASQSEKAMEQINGVVSQVEGKKGQVNSDASTIEQAKNRFESLKSQAETLQGELSSQQQDLQSQIGKIQRKADNLKQLEQELTDLKAAAEASKVAAETANQGIQGQQQTFQTSIEQTNKTLAELENRQNLLQGRISDFEQKYNEIKSMHGNLLVDEVHESGNKVACINTQISELLQQCLDVFYKSDEGRKNQEEQNKLFSAKQEKAFADLYTALDTKINSLLPGAGAAGLASSYYSAKLRYSITDDIVSKDGKLVDTPLFAKGFETQYTSLLINYGLFIVPLAFACYEFWGTSLKDIGTDNVWHALLFKLSVTLPLLIISGFGLSSILSTRKLYEEYNYKQRIMQLYHSFKEEIDNTNDPELHKKLLGMMMDVVKDKPSGKVSGGNKFFFFGKPLDKLLDKLSADKE